jgi:hypothetical protein
MAAITRRAYARIGLLGNPSGAAVQSCACARGAAADVLLHTWPARRADGYNGKTIALSLENYYAEARARCAALRCAALAAAQRMTRRDAPSAQVTLVPADTVSFAPHPVHDAQEFPSLAALAGARAMQLWA